VPEYIDRQMNTPTRRRPVVHARAVQRRRRARAGLAEQLSPQEIYRLGIAAGRLVQNPSTVKHLLSKTALPETVLSKSRQESWFSMRFRPRSSACCCKTPEGFFCDPIHGGNKGMVGWTHDRLPGARADFMDWVERNEQYPFPAVSIRGERA
jgi:gluconate 2-dehydrogenase gamma chain